MILLLCNATSCGQAPTNLLYRPDSFSARAASSQSTRLLVSATLGPLVNQICAGVVLLLFYAPPPVSRRRVDRLDRRSQKVLNPLFRVVSSELSRAFRRVREQIQP